MNNSKLSAQKALKTSLQTQKMLQCIQSLENEGQIYDKMYETMQKTLIQQAHQQIKRLLTVHREMHKKKKKSLTKQLNTLKYYRENNEKRQNLYPLLTSTNEKLNFNKNIIESLQISINLPVPHPHQSQHQVSIQKIKIYQNYIEQLINILNHQNITKYCKKQKQAMEKVCFTYNKLINNVKDNIYDTQVKMKGNFQHVLSQILNYRHLEDVNLSLISEKGILEINDYHELINSFQPNRWFLRKIYLQIMDMQFSQEKCDILKKRINNEFKNLKELCIKNYYTECKLGLFQDFNWHPYRKKVNIFSSVW